MQCTQFVSVYKSFFFDVAHECVCVCLSVSDYLCAKADGGILWYKQVFSSALDPVLLLLFFCFVLLMLMSALCRWMVWTYRATLISRQWSSYVTPVKRSTSNLSATDLDRKIRSCPSRLWPLRLNQDRSVSPWTACMVTVILHRYLSDSSLKSHQSSQNSNQ